MDRHELAMAVLRPFDRALGAVVSGAEEVGVLPWASDILWNRVKRALKANFVRNNDLEIEGEDNVPAEGGAILACNHQSWMDAQVLAASSPRRVHFVAKTELQSWPLLRHLITMTQSVFIHRGGDEVALEAIVEALRSGWVIGIFPEGTIPGEEEVPRQAIDPRTGLLHGHTGAARLALRAGVPIVPVGVSGTGRAFPPEIYPRLEILRLPAATPVRIRFGEPIDPAQFPVQADARRTYRAVTDDLMRRISALVDHRANYVPIELPLPEPPRRESIGVLLLHDFASNAAVFAGLASILEATGIDHQAPLLRGHGTRYQDLRGVTSRDWYVGGERALIDLWNWVDRIVVVGVGMGGLVALELGMRHPDKIAGVVTAGASVKLVDPKARLARLLHGFVRYAEAPDAFVDPERRDAVGGYPRFPTDALGSLYDYSHEVADRLRELHVPICIMQARHDPVVAPESANIIYEKVSSRHREILWFEESGHELLADLEADDVHEAVMTFIRRFQCSAGPGACVGSAARRKGLQGP